MDSVRAKVEATAKAKASSALSFSLLLFSWTNEVNWIVPCLDSGLRVASKKIVLSVQSEELRLASAYALAKSSGSQPSVEWGKI